MNNTIADLETTYGSQSIRLDVQNRFKIPTCYRQSFKDEEGLVITLDSQSPCLVIYSAKRWQAVVSSVSQLPNYPFEFKRIKRRVLGNARICKPDSVDRITITPVMKELIKLDADCVLNAQGDKFEIWKNTAWDEETRQDVNLNNINKDVWDKLDEIWDKQGEVCW